GRADQLGDTLTRQLDRFFRYPSKRVIAAGGVAELLHEVGQHFFENPRIHGRGRVIIHVNGQLDPSGSRVLLFRALLRIMIGGGRLVAIRAHDCLAPLKSVNSRPNCRRYEIVTSFTGFLVSGSLTWRTSGSSFICEIMMFFSTCSMLSFTFRSGSRMVHRSLCPHSPRTVTHEVMNNGPSMALITSNAEIIFGSRVSVYPPFMPCWDRINPTFASRCRIFASASCGMP